MHWRPFKTATEPVHSKDTLISFLPDTPNKMYFLAKYQPCSRSSRQHISAPHLMIVSLRAGMINSWKIIIFAEIKRQFCTTESYRGSLSALTDCPCYCAALRLHIFINLIGILQIKCIFPPNYQPCSHGSSTNHDCFIIPAQAVAGEGGVLLDFFLVPLSRVWIMPQISHYPPL